MESKKEIQFAKRKEFKDLFNEKDSTKRIKPLMSLIVKLDRVIYHFLSLIYIFLRFLIDELE